MLGCAGLVSAAGSRVWTFAPPALFTDITAPAGLSQAVNVSGSPVDKQFLLEEMGGGVALFDYDNDGWLDIFLVNGTSFDPAVQARNPTSYLFHNNRDGTFTDVTRKAGLTKSSGKASRSAKPGSSSSSKKLTAKQKKAKAAKITKLKATKVATVTKKTHTLKKLAKRYHVKGGWKAIYELNKGTVKKGAKKHLKHGLRIQLRT